MTQLVEIADIFNRLVDIFDNLIIFAHLKAITRQQSQRFAVLGLRALAYQIIGKKAQAAACRHLRVQLTQAACRRITRVGKLALAALRTLLVQTHKRLTRHIDLTAHIKKLRHRFTLRHLQRQRNAADGAHVGRNIFAYYAVTTGSGAHQLTVFVNQTAGQAVNLRLHNVFHLAVCRQTAVNTFIKGTQLLGGKHIAQAQQRLQVAHLGKLRGGTAADTLRRRIGRNAVRITRLQLTQAHHHAVIFGVRNLWRIQYII